MTKLALIVLAACADIRSGKRYERGDSFDPPPTLEQAKRLVAAGCLPEEALAAAEKGDGSDAKKAAGEKAAREKDLAASKKLVEVRSAKDTADQALENARSALAQAKTAEEKAAAEKALAVAEANAKQASEDLAELTN